MRIKRVASRVSKPSRVLYTEKPTGGCIQPPVGFVKNDAVDLVSAQKIAAVALFHRFVGVHEILAVGGGVARVRDELHGLGVAFTNRSKVPRSTLTDAKDPI